MFKKIVYTILVILVLLEIHYMNHMFSLINKNLEKINANVEQAQGMYEDNQNFDI
jgi:hypothetical protein